MKEFIYEKIRNILWKQNIKLLNKNALCRTCY